MPCSFAQAPDEAQPGAQKGHEGELLGALGPWPEPRPAEKATAEEPKQGGLDGEVQDSCP